MALTDTFVKNIKPTAAASGDKHSDGLGLYLHVKQAGKYWRLGYRFDGKQKLLALGVYPAVSLAKARSRRCRNRPPDIRWADPSKQTAIGRTRRAGRISLAQKSLMLNGSPV